MLFISFSVLNLGPIIILALVLSTVPPYTLMFLHSPILFQGGKKVAKENNLQIIFSEIVYLPEEENVCQLKFS